MQSNRISAVIACLLLAACTGAQDTASNVLDTAGTETGATFNKIRDIVGVGHKSQDSAGEKVQPRYCYKTYEDIICYSKPLPGEEYRLVGYQTAAGKTGYTMPPSPVPGGDSDDDNDDTPPHKSGNASSPPAAEDDKKDDKKKDDKQLKEIIFDPAELQPKELVPDKPQ